MAEDIGTLIFSQLLGMTQYPGSPFTGNLFRDLIMFLIVPTIFIILVIYTLSGRIVPAQVRLRVLLSIGVYLFIIAGGYYPVFALLAGPYFIFLIFILGILFYFMGHFTGQRPRAAGPPGGPGGYPMPHDYQHGGSSVAERLDLGRRRQIHKEMKDLEADIKRCEKRRDGLLGKPGMDRSIQAENDRIAEDERKLTQLHHELEVLG